MQISMGQAAANALAKWLKQSMSGDVVVYARWPRGPELSSGKRVISIIPVGNRTTEDMYGVYEWVNQVNTSPTTATVLIKTGEQIQPMQLDVWTDSADGRDDIIAQLDQVLYAGPQQTMNTLNGPVNVLSDPINVELVLPFDLGTSTVPGLYANSTCAFQFDDEIIDDDPDSMMRNEFRARYLGESRMAKTVMRTVPITNTVGMQLQYSEQPITSTFKPNVTIKPV